MYEAKLGRLTVRLYDAAEEPAKARETWAHDTNRVRYTEVMTKADVSDKSAQSKLGAPSLAELERRIREGWGEGADRLRKLATKEINPASIRRRRIKADQGAELDIHAVYRGDLSRAWSRTRREARTGARSVTILCNLTCAWSVPADVMFYRGAAALKLAEELTLAGYNVALYGVSATQNVDDPGRLDLAQFVEIKAEDAPLDVSALAALVAMPGYKRTRFHAAHVTLADEHGAKVSWGLGQPAPTETLRKAAALLPIPQAAFIQPEVNDAAAAERWIDEVLGQIESGAVAA
jgi:hypothetical protein